METERLDLYLLKNGHFVSRQKAQDAISQGLVTVNGKVPKKAGVKVAETDDIVVTASDEFNYVSRSAIKLKHALGSWKISVKDSICLDIGSSTGGFTQVLLEQGAREVHAVDAGTDQLHESLRDDQRVKLFEQTDIRTWVSPTETYNLVTIDVSFISIRKIFSSVAQYFDAKTIGIFLLKPQYELEPGIPLSSLVNSKYKKLFEQVTTELENSGLTLVNKTISPITGKDGAEEFLLLIKKIN